MRTVKRKKLTMPNADQDVKQQELSDVAGENGSDSHFRTHLIKLAVSQQSHA
jgi:hypothetical protein